MSRTILSLHTAPPLRVDARSLQPLALAALSIDEVARLPLRQGRGTALLGDFFNVRRSLLTGLATDAVELHLEGDCSRFDHLGHALAEGLLQVHGHAGDQAGCGMAGGELLIEGHAGDLLGCSMRGGWLAIGGSCGDLAASALPGDMDGMRGGTLLVRGNAGLRLADRMRRGTVLVFGDAGDFIASRMVAGTVALGGRCGAHPGYGMRRGSLVFAGAAPELPASFTPVNSNAEVFWQLLARDLSRHGGPFAELAQRRPQRHVGDLAAQGKGELLLVA